MDDCKEVRERGERVRKSIKADAWYFRDSSDYRLEYAQSHHPLAPLIPPLSSLPVNSFLSLLFRLPVHPPSICSSLRPTTFPPSLPYRSLPAPFVGLPRIRSLLSNIMGDSNILYAVSLYGATKDECLIDRIRAGHIGSQTQFCWKSFLLTCNFLTVLDLFGIFNSKQLNLLRNKRNWQYLQWDRHLTGWSCRNRWSA